MGTTELDLLLFSLVVVLAIAWGITAAAYFAVLERQFTSERSRARLAQLLNAADWTRE